MIKVLFVCLGNICRSPLAEAQFKRLIEREKLESKFMVNSAGTSDYHIGEKADRRTRKNAAEEGLNIDHLGQQLQHEDLQEYDYILAMDHKNLENINILKKNLETDAPCATIMLMRSLDETEGEEVPDPYFGGEEGFRNVFGILENANEKLLQHLIKKHQL